MTNFFYPKKEMDAIHKKNIEFMITNTNITLKPNQKWDYRLVTTC